MNLPQLIFFIGGGFSILLLLIGIIITVSRERRTVEDRINQMIDPHTVDIKSEKERKALLTEWINRSVEGSSIGDKIAANLAKADIRMKPGEYIALLIISAFGTGGLIWFISGGANSQLNILFGLLGAVLGLFLPGMFVKRQQKNRLIKFDNQLADMLNLMVNGLRAGYSTMQAMEAVSRELPPPISDEFRRVVQEMQLGVNMEQAMDNLLRRIPSNDLDLVITAINVQREVGGNLAEILNTISYTIRERVRIKGEIRVLTTQVRYSGQFLSLMPVFVILVLFLFNREYIMELFVAENQPCGYIALGVGLILIIAGNFIMNKLAQIEV
jgi:tight adherence protein B